MHLQAMPSGRPGRCQGMSARPATHRASSAGTIQLDPIHTLLALSWLQQGRTVPGQPDPEWRRLVDAVPQQTPAAGAPPIPPPGEHGPPGRRRGSRTAPSHADPLRVPGRVLQDAGSLRADA